jgi:hypothetical protein
LTIPQLSHAQLPQLTRRLALLVVGTFVRDVDGFVRSGRLPCRPWRTTSASAGLVWLAPELQVAVQCSAVPARVAVLTAAPKWSTV